MKKSCRTEIKLTWLRDFVKRKFQEKVMLENSGVMRSWWHYLTTENLVKLFSGERDDV
jgi:hypothetical protein